MRDGNRTEKEEFRHKLLRERGLEVVLFGVRVSLRRAQPPLSEA